MKFNLLFSFSIFILITACQDDSTKSTISNENIANSYELEEAPISEKIEPVTASKTKSIDTTAIFTNAEELNEDELRNFIMQTNCQACYGWNTKYIDPLIKRWPMSYNFMTGGILYAQGGEGEASMAEGTWKLNGNQLQIIYSLWYYEDSEPVDVDITVTARKSGEYLLLDNKLYWN
jgi:hypothetical protein